MLAVVESFGTSEMLVSRSDVEIGDPVLSEITAVVAVVSLVSRVGRDDGLGSFVVTNREL